MIQTNPTTPGIAEFGMLLNDYMQACVDWTRRNGEVFDKDVDAARAAVIASFADLEAQRDEARKGYLDVVTELRKSWEAMRAERDDLQTKLDAAGRDAERYRWLRDHRDEFGNIDESCFVATETNDDKWALIGPDLDAYIDAIAQRGGKGS